MGIFDGLKQLLDAGGGTKGSRGLAEGLEKARAEQAAAEAALAALQAERTAALTSGPDGLKRHKQAVQAAEERVDIARAYVERLEVALAEAKTTEEQRDALAAYKAAKREVAAAADRLTREYDEIGRRYADLLATCAKADLAARRANARLPEGQAPLLGPEALIRDRPAQPRQIKRTRKVKRWVYAESGKLVPDHIVDRVKSVGDGKGVIHHDLYRDAVELRPFEEITYIEAEQRVWGPRLAAGYFGPLRAGERPHWAPGRSDDGPESVLARLEEIERADVTPAKPELKIEYVPIVDDGEQVEPDGDARAEAA